MSSEDESVIDTSNENDQIEEGKKSYAESLQLDSSTTFDSLKDVLCKKTRQAIKEMGFTALTDIQAKTLPHLLDGKDVAASAKTGSGKTLAFLIPIVELLAKQLKKEKDIEKMRPEEYKRGISCLILSPTRELVMQTHSVLKELLQFHTDIFCSMVIGGVKMQEDIDKFIKGVDILVATPGRLLDHMTHKDSCFVYNNLKYLVIDEADRILDVGFEDQMKSIIKRLPKDRQTMLFSATLGQKTKGLTKQALKKDHMTIGLEHKEDVATVEGLTQGYIIVPSETRFLLLYTLIRKFIKKKVMVFFSSTLEVKFYYELFKYFCLPVFNIHGRQKQSKRTEQFDKFVSAESGTILCSDVAARGLDIPNVDWIIQYDPPMTPKEYIHRVGRTARGQGDVKGYALLFLRPEEKGFLLYLEKAKIPVEEFTFNNSNVFQIQKQLEKLIAKNHGYNLSARDAYMAYVRAYYSRKLKNVFDPESLDLTKVAKSFGLPVAPNVRIDTGFAEDEEEDITKKKRSRDRFYNNPNKKSKKFKRE